MDWWAEAIEQRRQERAADQLREAFHEAGHLVVGYLGGSRPMSAFVATPNAWSVTKLNVAGVDPVDVLVSYAAGRASLETFGWPNPEQYTAGDERQERLIAIQLAHLSPHGRATDLEYVDAIVDAGREEALRLAKEHWQTIDALAKALSQRLRLAGPELDAALDRAMLTVPAVRQREDALAADIERMNVRLGFAHPMRSYA
jgi:hypothetical protein